MVHLYLVILFSFVCFTFQADADPKPVTLTFNIGTQSSPPYMIDHKGQLPKGIFVDVITAIGKKLGWKVTIIKIPRNRIPVMLKLGELDATARAPEWEDNPGLYQFSSPLVTSRDVLYFKKGSKIPPSLEQFRHKRVGTHLGFKYPTLAPRFARGDLTRDDALTLRASLKKLILGRVDAVIIPDLIAKYEIVQNKWQNKLVPTPWAVHEVDYPVMFRKDWPGSIEKFNQALDEMKKNGSLAKIISRYQ
jgi:polar amino acid transport system substrate-binding protein